MTVADAPASPLETRLAYAAATLASLAWVGAVLPGTVLTDTAASPDYATPMSRGALLILPALLLLVSGPVGTILARGPSALQALLASGEAFVTLFVAGAIWHARIEDPVVLAASGVFLVLGCCAVMDVVATLRAVPRIEEDVEEETEDDGNEAGGVPPAAPTAPDPTEALAARESRDARPFLARPDLRLAIAVLVLVVPTSLVALPGHERASLLLPFLYVALSAFGCRFATGERGLRFVATLLLALVAAHLVISVRYVLESGAPEAGAWTWAGLVTFTMALGVLALSVARAVVVLRDSSRGRRAGSPA